MKRMCVVAAFVLLFVFGVSLLMGQNGAMPSQPNWEYRVMLYTDWVDTKQEPKAEVESLQSKLNQLGAEGWELIKLDNVVVLKRVKGLR